MDFSGGVIGPIFNLGSGGIARGRAIFKDG